MQTIFKGREVVDIQLEDVDFKDYPDFSDAHIGSGVWNDSGEKLSDEEVDEINETGVQYELVWEWIT